MYIQLHIAVGGSVVLPAYICRSLDVRAVTDLLGDLLRGPADKFTCFIGTETIRTGITTPDPQRVWLTCRGAEVRVQNVLCIVCQKNPRHCNL